MLREKDSLQGGMKAGRFESEGLNAAVLGAVKASILMAETGIPPREKVVGIVFDFARLFAVKLGGG